jgi:hypothetical protein
LNKMNDQSCRKKSMATSISIRKEYISQTFFLVENLILQRIFLRIHFSRKSISNGPKNFV